MSFELELAKFQIVSSLESAESLLALIEDGEIGKAQFLQLVEKLDTTGSGKRTILYSSQTGSLGGYNAAREIAAVDDEIRFIGDTIASQFLDGDDDYAIQVRNKLNELFNGDTNAIRNFAAGTKIPGSTELVVDVDGNPLKGYWDTVSRNFVLGAEGNIITLSANADINDIFGRTEIAAALEAPKVTGIDGLSTDDLRLLRANSSLQSIEINRVRLD